MKLLSSVFLFMTCLFLTSCAKFSDGTSVWQGGLWIIPTLTFLGSVFFGVLTYKSHKSNSKWNPNLHRTGDAGNVPVWEIGFFWFSLGLLLATIIIILMVISNR